MEEWQKSETITLWFVIAVLFLTVLLIFIVILVRLMFRKMVIRKMEESQAKLLYQQKLLNSTIKTQEKERERIAADLHDALISKLTVLQLKAQIEQANKESEDLVKECISIARGISHDLSPPLLEHTSLVEILEDLFQPWRTKFKIEFKSDIRIQIEHSIDLKTQLTRIVQEVITNISKHSKASKIDVHFRQSKRGIALLIAEDGRGFTIDRLKLGLGLQNIETRVQFIKGKHKIKSQPEHGTSNLFLFNLNA